MKRYFTYLLSIVMLAFALSFNLAAQVNLSDMKGDLPKMLGANNVGKEFWFSVPPCYEDESGGHDNFVKVFVTSAMKTQVNLEVPGKGFKLTKTTIPNDVIEFNIPAAIAQPWSKDGHVPAPPEQVWRGAGFHITADQPLVVYVIIRYWYTSDGFLALPVSALGKEYVCATYPDMSAMYPGYNLPSEVTITGAFKDTKVTFTLGGNPLTTTSGGMKPKDQAKATLQPGDVWTFATVKDEADLTGSRVVASKPVSVVSGNQCSNIPTDNRACDYIVEADLPTYTWGTDYHVPKVPKRKKPSIIRIFAKEPQTKIFRDGNQIGLIPEGPGGGLGRAYLEMRMNSLDPGVQPSSVMISGDKPIAVTLYNTGVAEDGYPTPNSDPFIMSITQVQQYQKEITFCTPGVNGSGFPENYINVVYQTTEFGMIPDDLEFAEVNSGQYVWYKMKSKFSGTDELFKKDLDNKKYAVKCITLPKDGVYKIRAKQPFACYSFGYSYYDSYGYPTSAALADLEKPDTLCPKPIWSMNCQGEIKGATVEDMPRDPEVRSNLAMIVLHSDSTFNFDFKYTDFEPGATSTTNWECTVIDPTQDGYAVITFTDRRGNDTTIYIKYAAIKLDIQPKNVDWGTLKIGETVTKDFEGINLSLESPVTINKLQLRTGTQGFEIVDAPALPFILGPNSKFPFRVKFIATTEGSFKDSIGIGDTCFFWNKSFIKAKVGEPIIDVTDIAFGDQRVGVMTSEQGMDVTNSGSVDLTITGATGPFMTVYTSDLEIPTATNPLVIAPGKTHSFLVKFKPDAVKSYPDSVVFKSDARSRKNVGYISGRGIEPGLEANGYDWNRRRIDRPGTFPIAAYPTDNAVEVIKLFNSGTMNVKINGLNIITNTNGDAFEFDRGIFDNMVIEPNGFRYVPVKFHPKAVGDYELTFSYNNDAKSDTKTSLKGIGILPRIKTTNYDFDTTMVNDKLGPKVRTITFTNDDYTYGDSLTLTDFVVGNNVGDINPALGTYGAEGFNYDKTSAKLPIVLQRGQSVTFEANFMAPMAGPHDAKLTSVSDAEKDQTSLWNGYGLSPGINITSTTSTICTGVTSEITFEVSNTGTGDLEILSLAFQNTTGNLFSFKDPTVANGFLLNGKGSGNEKKTITVVFTPGQFVGQFKNIVIIKNSTQTNPEVKWELAATSVHYAKKISASLPQDKDKNPYIGQTNGVDLKLNVTGVDDTNLADKADIKEISVVLTYNADFLKVVPASIQLGSLVSGKFQHKPGSPVIDDINGKITVNLIANPNQIFKGNGEILSVNFNTYLPTGTANTDASVFTPVLTIYGSGALCVDVTNETAANKLRPTCVYDVRKIIASTTDYSLSNIKPNPVSGPSTKISFGVGLESNTEILIVNSNGQVVAKPVSGHYGIGEYEIDLNVENMSSGVYFIKMNAGAWSATRELVITK